MLIPSFVIALLVTAAHFYLRKEFVVHTRGVILVTGASSGIGRDAATHLSQAGYTVFAGVRKPSDAESILNSNTPNMIPVILDVTDHDACAVAIKTVSRHMEEHDVPFVGLVNNAGVSRRSIAEFHSVDDIRTGDIFI
jgi:NADP-dependent 3-hydroxy acid dehydrogenase YdfG